MNENERSPDFLLSSLTDFERYINTNDAIIIRLLISESPLQLVVGISTPTIEKVLVDIVGDVKFSDIALIEKSIRPFRMSSGTIIEKRAKHKHLNRIIHSNERD